MSSVHSIRPVENRHAINQLAGLLHVFHHRNKNQHRRSIWWRHFSSLRRQLNILNDEVSTLTSEQSTHVERARFKTKRTQIEARIGERLQFWQDVLVANWHRAFSQLAADGRFAALGLVLLAVLAELCSLTAVTNHLEELAEVEVQKTLLDFGHELWDKEPKHSTIATTNEGVAEDLGVSLARAAVQEMPKGEKKSVPKIRRTGKKKRPTGNAIDDLFGGL